MRFFHEGVHFHHVVQRLLGKAAFTVEDSSQLFAEGLNDLGHGAHIVNQLGGSSGGRVNGREADFELDVGNELFIGFLTLCVLHHPL